MQVQACKDSILETLRWAFDAGQVSCHRHEASAHSLRTLTHDEMSVQRWPETSPVLRFVQNLGAEEALIVALSRRVDGAYTAARGGCCEGW